MSAPTIVHPDAPACADWRPLFLGVAVLGALVLFDFAHLLWLQGEKLDNALILAIALALAWRQRPALRCLHGPARPWLSGALLLAGLALFVIARSQTILFFEGLALVLILVATLYVAGGPALLRALAFPLLLLLFVAPLPGVFVDALTGQLKQFVSLLVEWPLHALGYPIARDGVVLYVGPYHLLVADACSGINSIFSLSAVGLVYLYLFPAGSTGRVALLLASILPIAILANVLRVLVLVLITYHHGHEAGQGYAHSVAHLLLFTAAVGLLAGLDRLLGLLARARRRAPAAA